MVHISCCQTRQPAEFSRVVQVKPNRSQYLSVVRDGSVANTVTALEFWQQRQAKYDKRRRKLLMARGARAPHFLSHESPA